MKKLSLLTLATLLAFAVFNANAEKMNLLTESWEFEPGVEMEPDDDFVTFKLTNAAADPWGGCYVQLVDIDVDKFSKITITTTGEEGVQWNLKIAVPDEEKSYSFFSQSFDAGDQTEFGTHTFDLNGLEITEHFSGEQSFTIWLFLVGHGESLTVTELYLTDGNDDTAIDNNTIAPGTIINRAGGITLKNLDNSNVSIYSVEGKLVKTINNVNSALDIDLQRGTYIVNINGKSAKIAVL